jgi:hypothetical protein
MALPGFSAVFNEGLGALASQFGEFGLPITHPCKLSVMAGLSPGQHW